MAGGERGGESGNRGKRGIIRGQDCTGKRLQIDTPDTVDFYSSSKPAVAVRTR